MINIANNSSNNWMIQTVLNLLKAIVNQHLMMKKLKFYLKILKLSLIKELKTCRNQRIHQKNLQNKFNLWKRNSKELRNKFKNKKK
jgi:hypothetical protein